MNNQKNTSGTLYPNLVVTNKHYHSTKGPPIFFVMMRLNNKIILLLLIILVILITSTLWDRCGDMTKEWKNRNYHMYGDKSDKDLQTIEELDCLVNGDYVIDCRKEGDEVYIPFFSFLHKYFEIYGKVVNYDGKNRFEWSHSYSRIYQPKGKYDPRGVFMHFENYNVEIRDRVKCVSGIDGVPISTQWESQGYYYPTQIAQFGLSHYSKNLTEPEPRRKVLEDADKERATWTVPLGSSMTRTFLNSFNTEVLNFTTDAYTNGIKLKLDHVLDFVITLNIFLQANSSLTVVLQNREKKDSSYNLHYISSDFPISTQDNNIYHGIGSTDKWRRITRDLIIDLQKGLNYVEKDKSKYKISRSKLKIVNIILRGRGSIDNLTLSSAEHIMQFYDSAEWFVKNQNEKTGGWPIPVRRKLASGFQELKPGWYSAMGQGHAISVLARAYYHSGGDQRFLKSALAGLKPFQIPSGQGGVLATFMNKYHWYEEYPTKPSSFVLNGFIYSLLGLYDLMTIAPPNYSKEAELLYNEGMVSLKHMLMLFDMSSTTSYDLRHFTLGIAPNVARWDYHSTHINQLLLLSTIDNELLFKQTADRWIGYMSGKRSAHN